MDSPTNVHWAGRACIHSHPACRYAGQVAELREYFSEYALIKHRIIVEIGWLQALAAEKVRWKGVRCGRGARWGLGEAGQSHRPS